MTTPFKTIDPSGDLDIYARKSVARKGQRDTELSVGQQIEDGIRWAKWNGYTPRHVWADHGISGSKDVKRPALVVQAGSIQPQGALAVLTIMERLEGRRIFFGADNLDTSEPKDRRMIMWRAEDAKEYRPMIDDEFRAKVAEWAELMTAAQRKYREREAIEDRRHRSRMQAFEDIRYAGVPAHLVREYQDARRKREAAENEQKV